MKNYLVTGVAGFIGAYVAKVLLKEGHRVVGIDSINNYYDISLKNYRIKNLIQNSTFIFYKINIEDKKELKTVFNNYKFAAVYNLAAYAGVRYSIKNPNIYINTNTIGTLNILELMKDYYVQKIILASTSSLYAGQKQIPYHENLDVNMPASPYAASKKAAESIAYTYHYLYNLDVSIVRYFTVYGPAGRPDMSIFRFIQWINNHHPVKIFGDGSYCRDFTYIDDIVKGTILARKMLGYEVINIGSGNSPITIQDIIKRISKLLKKKANIQYFPASKADMNSTWADIAKINKLFQWKPKTSLEEGLEKTISWHIVNQEWLKKIIM